MVGAVTTLIIIVAVFLAYNANNGLPFVPVYRVSVDVPSGARLVRNNEVRIGGHRVGVVESIETTRVSGGDRPTDTAETSTGASDEIGNVAARLNLKLDQSASPIPEDSIFRVRYRSSFGLKYLEIIRGEGADAEEGYVFNGLDDGPICKLPVDPKSFVASEDAAAKNGCFQPQTEFDAIANTFDTKTRTAARTNLVGFGDAFAGRGGSLNIAIEELRPLFQNLKPVARVLADPDTQLRRFIQALARTAEIVAPVAVQQADLFTQGAIAFDAISSNPAALRAAISEGRPLLEQGIGQLRRQRPFLAEFAELSRRLRPGVHQLRFAVPVLNDAVEVGTPVLKRSVSMNHKLRDVLVALKETVQQTSTKTSLQRLKDTFDTAKPLAKFVAPIQTVCNYWNYDWTFLAESLSDRDQTGFNFRQTIVAMPLGGLEFALGPIPIKLEGQVQTPLAGYSGLPANGRAGPVTQIPPNPDIQDGEFAPHHLPVLYGQPYAPQGQPNLGQYPDCQPGQTGYALGRYPIPGQPQSNPAVLTPDLPGSRGITNVFFTDSGKRITKTTNIPSHLPKPIPGISP
jgi:ABC-type transporter Mla subunit MlaD